MNQQHEIIYEEREVLWAKIRGYPWWPAHVNTVHPAQHPNDYQYTVIFFGDNTNSRLGPSKLRRFPDGYAQCFLKAKTNKKLRQSIQKAEQRLSQNHQNILIYQNIRNEILYKKKKGTISQSRLSSSQKIQAIQVPELTKNKTQQFSKGRRLRAYKKENQIYEQQSESRQLQQKVEEKQKEIPNLNEKKRRISQNIHDKSNKKQNSNQKKKTESNINISFKHEQTPEKRIRKTTRLSKQFESESEKMQKQQLVEREKYKFRKNLRSNEKQQKQIQKQENDEQSLQKQKVKKKQQTRGVERRGRPKGKKGRPPKSQQMKQKAMKQQEQEHQNESQSDSQKIKKPKIIKERRNAKNQMVKQNKQQVSAIQIGTLSEIQQQQIKANLSNRKQLVKVLVQLPINTENIKQILDLGVSLALQVGPITKKIHLLLSTLKATLLHKYFPDNNKHRRKYEKMSKQIKKIVMHSEQQENENNSQNQNSNEQNNKDNQQFRELKILQKTESKNNSQNNPRKQKNKIKQKKKQQNMKTQNTQNNLNLIEIKQKAIAKLQKMIAKAGLKQGAKFYAAKIQDTFQQKSDTTLQIYKGIAYKRMRELKTKLNELSKNLIHYSQLKQFIEQCIESYEKQNGKKSMHKGNY